MSIVLFRFAGGDIVLPNRNLVLVSREDGGNLVVNPPREVWERSELSPEELKLWSFLVAACGRAMIDTLPQLEGGCINFWEAGNWALNEQATPVGRKTAPEFRRVHLHLLGRSPNSRNPSLKWGEAPRFPDYAHRLQWAEDFQRLSPIECQRVLEQTTHLLATKYSIPRSHVSPWISCRICHYPTVMPTSVCDECATSD